MTNTNKTSATTTTPLSTLVVKYKSLPKGVKYALTGVIILTASTWLDGFQKGYRDVNCSGVTKQVILLKDIILESEAARMKVEDGFTTLYVNGYTSGASVSIDMCY